MLDDISQQKPLSAGEQKVLPYLNNRQNAPWHEVVEDFKRAIASAVIKTLVKNGVSFDRTQVDELIHEVYVKLGRDRYRILRHSRAERPAELFGLVQTTAVTVTLDWLSSTGRQVPTISLDNVSLKDEPKLTSNEELEIRALILQMEDCLEARSREAKDPDGFRRDCTLFWLHYRQGFTAKEIAAMAGFQLGVKGVESAIHRILKIVRSYLRGDSAKFERENS